MPGTLDKQTEIFILPCFLAHSVISILPCLWLFALSHHLSSNLFSGPPKKVVVTQITSKGNTSTRTCLSHVLRAFFGCDTFFQLFLEVYLRSILWYNDLCLIKDSVAVRAGLVLKAIFFRLFTLSLWGFMSANPLKSAIFCRASFCPSNVSHSKKNADCGLQTAFRNFVPGPFPWQTAG